MSVAMQRLAQARRPPAPRLHLAGKRRRRRAPPVAADGADADADAAAADAAPLASSSFAVIGAGLAGLAAAYHLVDLAPSGSRVVVFDAGGIGAGGSGAAAGLLHPLSPRGRPLWGAGPAMAAAARALEAAERAAARAGAGLGEPVAWRTGMLRPAADAKQARDFFGAAEEAAEKAAAAAEAAAAAAAVGGGAKGGGGSERDLSPWLGGAAPRALLTAEEARALLPGVEARDFAPVGRQEEEEQAQGEEEEDAAAEGGGGAAPSPADAARRQRQKQKGRRREQRAGDPAAAASALLVPSGVTLHPRRYMEALWRACRDLAAERGGGAELRLRRVASVAELLREGDTGGGGGGGGGDGEGGPGNGESGAPPRSRRPWRGVVVAAGAAVGTLPEAREAGLPGRLSLVRGWSLDVEWAGAATAAAAAGAAPLAAAAAADAAPLAAAAVAAAAGAPLVRPPPSAAGAASSPLSPSPPPSASAYPPDAPSLLGRPYLASQGGRALVVGAAAAPAGRAAPTAEEAMRACLAAAAAAAQAAQADGGEGGDELAADATDADAADADAAAAAAAAAADAERELIEGAGRAWPPLLLLGGGWRAARVRTGVRAVPPRSPQGALPLVGRLVWRRGGGEQPATPLWQAAAVGDGSGGSDGDSGDSGGSGNGNGSGGNGDEEDDAGADAAEVWVVAGLGARGLVYHAWLGELAARGVVGRTEAHVPPELLRWRQRD